MKSKSLLTLVLVPLMVGCGQSNPASSELSEDSSNIVMSSQESEITFKDGQGRDVTINTGKLDKVICIGAGALRYYSYVGDISKIIAVEEIDSETSFGVGQALRPYYMAGYDHFKTLPTIGKGGPMAQVADAEKLAAAQPDIIISFLSAEANTTLQSTINVPIIGLSQGPDGVFDDKTLYSLGLLGAIFDRTDEATALKYYIKACKADFANLTMTEDTYYFGGIGNWGQTSMYGSMLGFPVAKYAKVKSALDDIEFKDKDGNVISKGQVTLDMEKLQSANPDHIFMDTAGINGFISDYKKEGNKAKYDALKAFSTGETYQLMPYNAYYSNLEVQLMSTYYVASVAHDNFTIDLDAKMNEITKKFLGKEMYNDIKAHTYGMGGYKKVDLTALGE
ncbi:MAG: ABC transporter substrate-binding protein [Bacilli bacterium]|nr:ABC transporter substrate-binding protein [Bacilli bacterium]